MRVSPEEARRKLAERRARLARFIEIDAPDIIIREERRMIADAIYALETGEWPVRPEEGRSTT